MNFDFLPSSRPGSAGSRNVESNSKNSEELKAKVETKILSIWHNVKYGFSGKLVKPRFSNHQPVWLLGRCYHRKFSPNSSMESSLQIKAIETELTQQESYSSREQEEDCASIEYPEEPAEETGTDATDDNEDYEEGIEGFRKDFFSKIWFTYRKEFPTLDNTNLKSDAGWGCMIRSGQMILAHCLVVHFLGRGWRYDCDSQICTAEDLIHRKIVRWFGDQTSKISPFSLHSFVKLGKEIYKKTPGEWYGPQSIAHLIKQSMKNASQENIDLTAIHVCVAQDSTIYIQDILDECFVSETETTAPWQQHSRNSLSHQLNSPSSQSSTWKPLILLVPLRLGQDKLLNPIYGDCLKALMSLEYCVGIIGGRPKHSLYFVGYQEDKLIFIDPHYTQDHVDVNQENFSITSFHCNSPRKMKIQKIDPSLTIGFYCATKQEFDKFRTSVQPYLLPTRNYCERQQQNCMTASDRGLGAEYNYPMFVFCNGRSSEQNFEMPQRVSYREISNADQRGYNSSDELDDDDSEDFVII